MGLDLAAIRRQFPFLHPLAGNPPVYFDSAATAQKPDAVIEAIVEASARHAGNVHRGIHRFAEDATTLYEQARQTVQHFLGAAHSDEIVFTRNATEGINLVAQSWGRSVLKPGDRIVLTLLEHHSNIVPWMQLHESFGVELVWIDINEEGHLNLEALERELQNKRTKLVAVTGQSNVLGVRPPLREIITMAHATDCHVLVDGAQLVAHAPMDVAELDCDFLVFSGHKLYGPTGIGVLYGKREHLRSMPPFLGGGGMVESVSREGFVPAEPPARFEAGTPAIAEAHALGAAIHWLGTFSWDARIAQENALLSHALQTLQDIPGLSILGPRSPQEISGCLSFTMDGVHPHDLTELLGAQGFALRAGQHCAAPLHERLSLSATTRLSIGLYNTIEEIDALATALRDVRSTFL